MDNKIGIIREFDNLGRLVIPKEMRTLFDFNRKVEIVVTENGVLLRIQQNQCKNRKNAVRKTDLANS